MANKSVGFLTVAFGADLRGFDRAMRKAQRRVNKFGKNLSNIGSNITRNVTLPVLGLGGASIKLASDLNETRSKFNTVFSSIQHDATKTASTFKESFGLSSQAALDMLGSTGDLLVGFGFTEDEALNLSKQVNELAVDLASFTNFAGGSKGASEALTKALLGEREAIKSLGIAITEADLKRFAEEQGLVFKELDRVAKAQLTFDLALRQSGKAVGDFQRTQNQFANQVRILRGDVTDLGAEFGNMLLPIAQKLVDAFQNLLGFLRNLSPEFKTAAMNITLIVAAIGPLISIGGLLVSKFALLFSSTGLLIVALGGLVAAFLYVRDNFEALKERLSDFGSFRNAIIDITEFFITDFFEKIEKRLNFLRKLIGKDPIPIDFSDAITTLDGFRDKTKDFEHDFKSFGDSMKSQAAEIGNALKDLMNPLKLGGFGGAEIATGGGGQMNIFPMPEAFYEFNMLSDKVIENTDKMTLKMALFGDVIRDSMTSAIEGTESFAQAFIRSIKEVIKRLLIQLAIMLAIQVLLGGKNIKDALSMVNIKDNLGSMLGVTLAEGGIISGPTMALMGEYSGVKSNPEVVAPLSKLKTMIGGGSQKVEVFGRISGSDIFISNERMTNKRLRAV
tara:strand:+ start:2068 stop:3924 length:1857 start_codon:yes stop_codon:yes gene_type:complete